MQATASTVSRRSFLAGAGAALAGTAAVAAAGVALADEAAEEEAPAEETAASGNALSAWGTEYPWAAEPPAIADDQIEEQIDCDVCVIGLGVAGVAAFRSAAEAGAVTVAFEKGETPGVRSSQYCYINGTMTEQLGLATVDEDTIINAEWNESAQVASYPIIRNFVRNESDVFDWWVNGDPDIIIPQSPDEELESGMPGDPDAPSTVTSMVDLSLDWENESQAPYPTRVSLGNHAHVVNANVDRAVEAGGTVYYGHFGEQVIMEDGRCVGAYVRNAETGMYKKVNATKGVVLSMGGCGSNKEYISALFPVMAENGNLNAWPNMDVEGKPTDSGDVFPLGYWAGAAFSQNMCAMTHVMGGPNDIASMDASSGFTGPMLRLNYHGERFMNEDSNVSDCELALDRQPKRKAFIIFDSHLDEQVADGMVCEFSTSIEATEEAVDNETVFKGETLEELFDAIVAYDADFDKETALASVERYNELCASGVDEDFGKKEKYLYPVQDGPFYAQRFGIGLCLTTMGGLASDEYAHVISTERQVIPGLYVAGNSQGDRFAVKYPFKLSGASHAMAMYYGYVAGQSAANGI